MGKIKITRIVFIGLSIFLLVISYFFLNEEKLRLSLHFLGCCFITLSLASSPEVCFQKIGNIRFEYRKNFLASIFGVLGVVAFTISMVVHFVG